MTLVRAHTWQSIHAELIRRIGERIWAPGEFVPKEIELAAEFGCSRSTINRAMQELANAGLLTRKRRAGTRVALHPVRKATLEIPVIRLDVEGRGQVYTHDLLERRVQAAPTKIAQRLGLPSGAHMLHLRALHLADEQPFAYEDRWVNSTAFPAILKADFNAINANEWLVQNAPLSSGDISFCAVSASSIEARLLNTKVGAALFRMRRVTRAGRAAVTHVDLTYAPGFQMQTRL